ncbi:MAG: hypothetical protein A3H98_00085 [Bacteroidetes bacterium RIFCSPLOWO2_02_FULL_36_8]|nr:MAG: hypothetical protein A3H98_00085 [Bacteroidetes bacterium RIFCSPLOWO2_02_FULL_36_8]OFY69809.1 MAG: hypothetical protein A3G23_14460 [Bacteroidetes bacterium RIFCSPLOWO2_12_FULL_37_12]
MKIFKVPLYIICLFLFACRSDVPEDIPKPDLKFNSGQGVYITCEGNFQFGNAKISFYDITGDTVIEDIYQPANNSSLGDVCQSMYFFNNKIYIIINNSGKIVVVNPDNFKLISEITGFISPRYFLPVSNSKAYITDLYANKIGVVDLSAGIITGQIPCKGWTEELLTVYGKVFVTNLKSEYIYIINSSKDVLEDSIKTGFGSNSIVEDKNGKLWVLCSGNQTKNVSAVLNRINPISQQIEKSLFFRTLSDSPWRLDINGTKDTLYFINTDVFRISINDSILPIQAFISQGNKNFYGIGIDPKNGDIYIADAVDYIQRGVIYRYKRNGSLIRTFRVGILPVDFYFK